MPRKPMRTVFSSPTASKPSASPSPTPTRPSFSESVMDRTLELAGPVIAKWSPDTAPFASARVVVTSLFPDNRGEAKHLIKCVNNLQKAMHLLLTENPTSPKLASAQNLMQTAMKTLQREFYQLLSMNRAYLDPESVSSCSTRTSIHSTSDSDSDSDDDDEAADSIVQVEDASSLVMADLRLIAECMISSGYAKECVKIYNIIRKSIIDEGMYRLGVEKFSSSSIHNMDWEVLDDRIKKWLDAVKVSVKTLFNGERILSDHVFAASESIRESCFTEISREGAMILFGFPESVVRNSKKSPEKAIRVLDMYTAIATHWPDIKSIFSSESSSTVRSQAITSLIKMGQYVRTALAEFESAILKERSKSTVAGGAVHHLTIDSMNYLSLLADYSNPLSDILADSPPPPASTSTLLESYSSLSDSGESPAPTISLRFAWLILLLLAKLDGKAKLYKDASLSYLFLANNFQYVITKVRTSNLKYLLGDDWLPKQEVKVRQFAANYQRLAWGHVIESLPEVPAISLTPEEARECFKRFNASFEQAHDKQSACVIPDSKLRDDIKVDLSRRILPVYREFYNKHEAVTVGSERNLGSIVRFSPEDVGHCLSDLFFGNVGSGSSSSSSLRSPPSHTRSKKFYTSFVGLTTRYALSFFGSPTIKF
ncbi:exocyst complex component EXO70H1-like [Coffea eugenioides]|uniref:exocyst complex component EXO70H1-like n=1 Tax=Coffea eugenioides TaxID=49369 RepID=UPI000F60EBAF|nr:exocyst complex component EXO70H1-like [Coffea eugenioides]